FPPDHPFRKPAVDLFIGQKTDLLPLLDQFLDRVVFSDRLLRFRCDTLFNHGVAPPSKRLGRAWSPSDVSTNRYTVGSSEHRSGFGLQSSNRFRASNLARRWLPFGAATRLPVPPGPSGAAHSAVPEGPRG